MQGFKLPRTRRGPRGLPMRRSKVAHTWPTSKWPKLSWHTVSLSRARGLLRFSGSLTTVGMGGACCACMVDNVITRVRTQDNLKTVSAPVSSGVCACAVWLPLPRSLLTLLPLQLCVGTERLLQWCTPAVSEGLPWGGPLTLEWPEVDSVIASLTRGLTWSGCVQSRHSGRRTLLDRLRSLHT